MAELSICPHCGRSLPLDPSVEASPIVFAPEASRTIETMVPATSDGEEQVPHCAASTSRSSNPPIHVGEDGATAAPATEPGSSARLRGSDEYPTNGSGEFDPLASPVADPHLDAFASASSDTDGGDPASWPAHPAVSNPDPATPPPVDAGEEIERAPWLVMLLASYASALTIAVAWLLWHGYGRGMEIKPTLPPPTRTSSESRLRNLVPLDANRKVGLGKTLSIGNLKLTPLSIISGPVMLESVRPNGSVERREGGTCLILTLRLENTSKDASFAPLERSAVRQGDSGESESLIGLRGSILESYPLAITSEQSIVGQSLETLRPGESVTTILVSEPDAKGRLDGPALWRVPFSIGQGFVIVGVEFSPDDVH